MQLPPLRDTQVRSRPSSTDRTDHTHHLRIRLGSNASGMVDRRLADRSWKEAFGVMVEASLREAEDIMLSLPYTQIRHQFRRFTQVLEIVPARNMVRVDPTNPSSAIIDIDLKNIITTEHQRFAPARSGYVNGDSQESCTHYSGNREGDLRLAAPANFKVLL